MPKAFPLAFAVLLCTGMLYADDGFVRLIKLPHGAAGSKTPCFAADMDHDGFMEFGMYCKDENSVFEGWQIWKCIPPDSFALVHVDTLQSNDPNDPGGLIPWDVGDVDKDGKTELVGINMGEVFNYVQTVESDDYFSCPSEINWMSAYGGGAWFSTPFYLTDLDQDGKTDILFVAKGHQVINIYENVQNDSCRIVWADTLDSDEPFYLKRWVWGDFDNDGLVEFLSGGIDGDFVVWEHTGADNQYQRVYTGKADEEYATAYDVFGGQDMDTDGVPEFFFSLYWGIGSTPMELWRYYAVGDNTYESELVDTVSWAYVGMAVIVSDVGDVDGDGLLEVVWSLGTRIRLLDDAQHGYAELGEWQNDHYGMSDQCLVTCADLTLDGRDEILVTGCFRTSILQWTETGIAERQVEYPRGSWQLLSPIGSEIKIRYTDYPEGFHARVFDASGRKVDELHSATQSGTLYWGEGYAPGVYFILPQEDSSSKTRKVLLLH